MNTMEKIYQKGKQYRLILLYAYFQVPYPYTIGRIHPDIGYYHPGHHTMGSYCNSNPLIRPYIPYRHGPWGLLLTPNRQNPALILFSDSPLKMACPSSNPWCRCGYSWLFPRSRPWWSSICAQHPCLLRNLPNAYACNPGYFWHLPKTPFGKRHQRSVTSLCCDGTWHHRESNACGELGANAIRGHHCVGLL